MDGNAPKPMMSARAYCTFNSSSWRWVASDFVSDGATECESESLPPLENRSLICISQTDFVVDVVVVTVVLVVACVQ